jgi:hypothetical protein
LVVLVVPSLFALVLAAINGRSLAGLTRQPIAWWPLGLAAFGAELALTITPLGQHPIGVAWGSMLWLVALSGMAAMLGRNAWLRSSAARWGWAVAAGGVLLNVLVVAINDGHMPQSQEARVAAGASVERVSGLASEPGWRNVSVMTDQTRLPWLGDVLPEPAWLPVHNVLSVGDLLLAGGLGAAVYLATARGSRRLKPF